MTLKNKFILYPFIGIVVILTLMAISINFTENKSPYLTYIEYGLLIFFFFYAFGILFLTYFERKHMEKHFKLYEKNLDELISFSQKGLKKYWLYSSVVTCKLKLGITYLLKNDIPSAKEALADFGIKSAYIASYYPNFILAIIDGDMSKAKQFYQSLIVSKNKKFNQQKDFAKRIMAMIENKVFDEALYEETNFACIKELCLKYKN